MGRICNLIIVAFLLLVNYSNIYAQSKTWGENGSHWYYELIQSQSSNFIVEVEKSRDTIVLGKSCAIYSKYFHYFDWSTGNPIYTGRNLREEFITYQNADTTFFLTIKNLEFYIISRLKLVTDGNSDMILTRFQEILLKSLMLVFPI